MSNRKPLLISRLTSLIQGRLTESSDELENDLLYRAFFIDPTGLELRIPDKDKRISGKDYLIATILSTEPNLSDPNNPKLKVRIWPSYEVYEYVGPNMSSGAMLKKGERITYTNTETVYTNVPSKSGGTERIEQLRRYKDPSDKYGGHPQDYVIPPDAPTVVDKYLKYKEAEKLKVLAVKKNELGSKTAQNAGSHLSGKGVEDYEQVISDIQAKSTVFLNLTDTGDITRVEQLFKRAYDFNTYPRTIRQSTDAEMTAYVVTICAEILSATNLSATAQQAILRRLTDIQKDTSIASKNRLSTMLGKFKEFLLDYKKESFTAPHFLYDSLAKERPSFQVYTRKLKSFDKFTSYDYINEYPSAQSAFAAAAADFLKALQTEKLLKEYFIVQYPSDKDKIKREQALDALINSYKQKIADELKQPRPSLGMLYELFEIIVRQVSSITSMRSDLKGLFEKNYATLSPEEGFQLCREKYIDILKNANISSDARLDIVKEIDKLTPRTPYKLLEYINRELYKAERPDKVKHGSDEEDDSKDAPTFSSIMFDRVETDSVLKPSDYETILDTAVSKAQLLFTNLTHSGLPPIIVSEINIELSNTSDLASIGVVIDNAIDCFDVEDVRSEVLRHLSTYAQTALNKLLPDQNLADTFITNSKTRIPFPSVDAAVRFLNAFKAIGAGQKASVSGISNGISSAEVLKIAESLLTREVVANKYIDGAVKSGVLTRMKKLLNRGYKALSDVDKLFTAELKDTRYEKAKYQEQFKYAYEEGLEAIRTKGIELYKSRAYKPIPADAIKTDLDSYNTFTDIVLYLETMLGDMEVTSLTYKDLSTDMLNWAKYVLKEIMRQAPNSEALKSIFPTVDNLNNLPAVDNFISRVFCSERVMSRDTHRRLKSEIISTVTAKTIRALDQVKALTMEVKQVIIGELYHSVENANRESALENLDGILKALTGLNQTGIQAITFAKGGVQNARNIFANIATQSKMSPAKKKQILNSLLGSSWNSQSDKRPITSVPRIRQFAINMALSGEGLNIPGRKRE